MDERAAHDMYVRFKAVDAGARHKQCFTRSSVCATPHGLGFSSAADGNIASTAPILVAASGDLQPGIRESSGKRARNSESVERTHSGKWKAAGEDMYNARGGSCKRRDSHKLHDSKRYTEDQGGCKEQQARDAGSKHRRDRVDSNRSWGHNDIPQVHSDKHHPRQHSVKTQSSSETAQRRTHRSHRDMKHSRHQHAHDREQFTHSQRRSGSSGERKRHAASGTASWRHNHSDNEHEGAPAKTIKSNGGKPKCAVTRVDFDALIPGYASMAPSMQMRARTKLSLQRASEKDDHSKRHDGRDSSQQWTRFAFSQDALLEEEGARTEDGFDASANMVSFRLSMDTASAQQANDAHEEAIFGKTIEQTPVHLSETGSLHETGHRAAAKATDVDDLAAAVNNEVCLASINTLGLVAESVALDKTMSWRERAAHAKAQRAARQLGE